MIMCSDCKSTTGTCASPALSCCQLIAGHTKCMAKSDAMIRAQGPNSRSYPVDVVISWFERGCHPQEETQVANSFLRNRKRRQQCDLEPRHQRWPNPTFDTVSGHV